MSYTLTESEAYDVAAIVANYAKEIRRDMAALPQNVENREAILRALEDAAVTRERLAKRIEDHA